MKLQGKRDAEVINLADLKEKKQLQRTLDQYQNYLRGLTLSQMEGEAKHLLEEFSGQNFGSEYLPKVQMLLGELATRADGGFRQAIFRLQGQLPSELG